MTDDVRNRYFSELKTISERHGARAFDYEEKAIEFANNALRALTYLNGGALVATPTAVALFHTDLGAAKPKLITAAALFVGGLISVVLSEPIRKVLESDESDVIPCWALDSRRSAPCGHPNIAALRTATACVIRAI